MVLLTGRCAGSDVLQGCEEQTAAQARLCESTLRGHIEHGVGLVQRGDQQLHQRAHLGFDTCTWGREYGGAIQPQTNEKETPSSIACNLLVKYCLQSNTSYF